MLHSFKKEGLKNKWQYCFAVTESGTQFQEELVQFVGWLIAFFNICKSPVGVTAVVTCCRRDPKAKARLLA